MFLNDKLSQFVEAVTAICLLYYYILMQFSEVSKLLGNLVIWGRGLSVVQGVTAEDNH